MSRAVMLSRLPGFAHNLGGWDSDPDEIASFLATTTAPTDSTPNLYQRPLFVASVVDPGEDTTLSATGAGQVIYGAGAASVLRNTSLEWENFSYGGAHGLYMRGVSDYGVRLNATGAGRSTWHKFSRLTVRDKTVAAFSIDGDTLTGVANIQISDVMAIGNARGLDIRHGANLDIVNWNSTSNTLGDYFHGIGELKLVNYRAQAPTSGPACTIFGDAARKSVESYIINPNFNEGAYDDDVVATTIEPHNGGTQLRVTLASAHKCLIGWQKFKLTSTTYSGFWEVADIESSTVVIIEPTGGPAAGGTYTVTEAGVFNRQHPGLLAEGESLGDVNDFWMWGGASNNTELSGVFNMVMAMRAFGGKERTWFEGECNRILFLGTGRGRGDDAFDDDMPGGPASHTGWAFGGVLDPNATLAPGGMKTGWLAPMKDWGVGTDNRPVGFSWIGVTETGPRLEIAEKSVQWKRDSSSAHMYADATDEFKATSDGRDIGVGLLGATPGNRSIVQPFSRSSEPNLGILLRGRGTGGADLGGSTVTQIRANNTGFYFWDGASLQLASFGAADSGGAGYRAVRIPN